MLEPVADQGLIHLGRLEVKLSDLLGLRLLGDGLNVRLRVNGLSGLAREMLSGGIGEAA